MSAPKDKFIHAFTSKKVVSIDDKKYTSLEKIPTVNSDYKNIIIILREVKLNEKVYDHPIKGSIYNYHYEKIYCSTKRYITLENWNELEDINIGKFTIHL